MQALVLGDMHGNIELTRRAYDQIVRVERKTPDFLFQVGDFGYGLTNDDYEWEDPGHPCLFIDGNHEHHDRLEELDEEEQVHGCWQYVQRGSIRHGILCVGGARSVYGSLRTPGVDWFRREVPPQDEMDRIVDIARENSDRIHTVISHDAPWGFDISEGLDPHMRDDPRANTGRPDKMSLFLREVFTEVQPMRWFFGHYHTKMSGEFEGCEWRCIDETLNGDYAWFEWE